MLQHLVFNMVSMAEKGGATLWMLFRLERYQLDTQYEEKKILQNSREKVSARKRQETFSNSCRRHKKRWRRKTHKRRNGILKKIVKIFGQFKIFSYLCKNNLLMQQETNSRLSCFVSRRSWVQIPLKMLKASLQLSLVQSNVFNSFLLHRKIQWANIRKQQLMI